MNSEPPHFFNYKGRIFKAIAIDGARTWDDLSNFTNLTSEDLNMVLSEMYDRNLIEKLYDKSYRIPSEIYFAYVNYYQNLNEQPNHFPKSASAILVSKENSKIDSKSQDESFESFIIQKLVELDLLFIKEYKKGGSAQLYLTYNPSVDDIQIFKLYTSTDEEIQEKYLEYESICTKIEHPNVNKILYTGKWEFNGHFYRWSVQEYIHPFVKSLSDIPKNTLLNQTSEIRLSLINQLINGILAIRDTYNTHNDIHAGNILISANNQHLKIIDPGFSRKEPGKDDTDLIDTKKIIEQYFIKKKEKQIEFFKTLLNTNNFRELLFHLEDNRNRNRIKDEDVILKKKKFQKLCQLFDILYYSQGKSSQTFALTIAKDQDLMDIFGIMIRNPQRVQLDDENFFFLDGDYYLIPNSMTLRQFDEKHNEIQLITKNDASSDHVQKVMNEFFNSIYTFIKIQIPISFNGKIFSLNINPREY